MDMSVTNMDERTDLFDKSHYKVPTVRLRYRINRERCFRL